MVRVHSWSRNRSGPGASNTINAFEKLLADEGTRIVKFFLHIDLKEQKKRLQERLDDPKKHWKFNPGDLDERKRWDEYMRAYEEVLSRTSTPWAPCTSSPPIGMVPQSHRGFGARRPAQRTESPLPQSPLRPGIHSDRIESK